MWMVPVSKSQSGYSRCGLLGPGVWAAAVTGAASTAERVLPRPGIVCQVMPEPSTVLAKCSASMETQPPVSIKPLKDAGGAGVVFSSGTRTCMDCPSGPVIDMGPWGG